jgi:hypothetical protein
MPALWSLGSPHFRLLYPLAPVQDGHLTIMAVGSSPVLPFPLYMGRRVTRSTGIMSGFCPIDDDHARRRSNVRG